MEINSSSLSYVEAHNLKKMVADIKGQLLCAEGCEGFRTTIFKTHVVDQLYYSQDKNLTYKAKSKQEMAKIATHANP